MLEVPLLELMKEETGYDRKFRRYRVTVPVLARTAAEEDGPEPECRGETLPGLTHNISLSGISFVCFGRFELGGLIEIEVTLEAQPHLLLARLRWCRQLEMPGDPMYHYGTQFVRTEAVLRFIPVAAEFLLSQGADRRPGLAPVSAPAASPSV